MSKWQVINNKKRVWEKLFYKKIQIALKKQSVNAYKTYKATKEITFNSKFITDIFVDLYKRVGVDFATWQYRQLNNQKDDDWSRGWEMSMEDYAINEAGSRIVLITGTNKERFITELSKITKQATEEGLGVDATTKLIEKELIKNITGYQRYMSKRIAQTEILSAANKGQMIAADSFHIPTKKVWMCGGVSETERHTAIPGLDGQERLKDEAVDVDGEALMYPGDPSGSPENVINCKCIVSILPV